MIRRCDFQDSRYIENPPIEVLVVVCPFSEVPCHGNAPVVPVKTLPKNGNQVKLPWMNLKSSLCFRH